MAVIADDRGGGVRTHEHSISACGVGESLRKTETQRSRAITKLGAYTRCQV